MLRQDTRSRTPYQDLLGHAYGRLHPHVRIAHEAPLTATGHVDVVHGSHPLTPFFITALRLPRAGAAMPVTLRVRLESPSQLSTAMMIWMRQIGTTRLDTRQYARSDRLVEESRRAPSRSRCAPTATH